MIFEPWRDQNAVAPEATNRGEPITEPPCKHCAYFKPQVKFRNDKLGLVPDGVVICHATEMYSDFCCFKMRE